MGTAETLMEMYRAMRRRFGHQAWWPGQSPLEICIGAILTQNTNWKNVERTIDNLKAGGCLSIAALRRLDHRRLAELIRPAGYFNIKAKRLKNFIDHVWESWGEDLGGPGGTGGGFLDRGVSQLREDLLSVNGIGRETADSIVLYAAEKPSFVVDAYTYRVLLRHHLIAPEDDYEAIKQLMESSLPEDVELWNDYHAQLVAVGKNYCRPRARCAGCPLETFPHDAQADRL